MFHYYEIFMGSLVIEAIMNLQFYFESKHLYGFLY